MGCGQKVKDDRTWWKGNLHTHSLWSDGDDYPEMIVDAYKTAGYHFLALSDHNTLGDGEQWIVPSERGEMAAYQQYQQRFGGAWVVQKQEQTTLSVRLKTLAEYRTRFEETGHFLLIQSEEITDGFDGRPVHVNATNLATFIQPKGGSSVMEVMQHNVDAVLEQRRETGQPMFPHINHPNFGWGVTVEDLMGLEGERFFEVYNGHPAVRNDGDAAHPGTERMWDIVLTDRIGHERPLLYGLAVDDSHNYHDGGLTKSNPFRGWVMVRAASLTADSLVVALERGDFYASTGVTLKTIDFDGQTLQLAIEDVPGVSYTTTFIGTRAGYAPGRADTTLVGERMHVRQTYSDEIGVVLATVEGPAPQYTLQGDELYVRARVVSSQPKGNPYQEGEVERAWTQPVRANKP